MKQLKQTSNLDKLKFLKTYLPAEHLKAYKVDFKTDEGVSYDYFNFVLSFRKMQ